MIIVHGEKGKIMTNAHKFKNIFGLYATELWAMPEKNFLEWLNVECEPSAQPEPQWIPCSERLPEERGTYIICLDGYVFCGIYHPKGVYDGKTVYDGYNWTDLESGILQQPDAWMQLPEPYQEGD